jgi:hypothetical protein
LCSSIIPKPHELEYAPWSMKAMSLSGRLCAGLSGWRVPGRGFADACNAAAPKKKMKGSDNRFLRRKRWEIDMRMPRWIGREEGEGEEGDEGSRAVKAARGAPCGWRGKLSWFCLAHCLLHSSVKAVECGIHLAYLQS